MERQLSPQNRNRPWTKLDDPVLVCFRGVLINSVYTGFGNREGPPRLIVVPNPKRNCRISTDWTHLISSEWDHPISG